MIGNGSITVVKRRVDLVALADIMTAVNFRMLNSVFSKLALLFTVLVTGCGNSETSPKAVDIAAQVAQLKGNADAQSNALSELASAGPKSAAAVNDIIPLLKSDDTVIRRLAAYALCQIGPAAKAALPELKLLMNDADPSTATTAINALNAIDPSSTGGIKVLNVTQ